MTAAAVAAVDSDSGTLGREGYTPDTVDGSGSATGAARSAGGAEGAEGAAEAAASSSASGVRGGFGGGSACAARPGLSSAPAAGELGAEAASPEERRPSSGAGEEDVRPEPAAASPSLERAASVSGACDGEGGGEAEGGGGAADTSRICSPVAALPGGGGGEEGIGGGGGVGAPGRGLSRNGLWRRRWRCGEWPAAG